MHLTQLQVVDFRNIGRAELSSGPGINWLYGDNGAGKTSILEAIYLLSRGRSFRSASVSPLIRDGTTQLTIFARTIDPTSTLGVSRERSQWLGKINGKVSQRISEFAQALPVVLVEPNNHALVHGGPELRRSFMDWGMFHVEPGYLKIWRRYSRLLQQRNAALKINASDEVLDVLEFSMAEAADMVDTERSQYVDALEQQVKALHDALGLRFSEVELEYPPQHKTQPYLQSWQENRARDREHGFTRSGPHRADLKVMAGGRLAAPRLSRGQQKLTALVLLLAQLQVSVRAGRQPLLLLDDPTSELDAEHLRRLLAWVERSSIQVWVAAVEPCISESAQMFHVEQGVVSVPG